MCARSRSVLLIAMVVASAAAVAAVSRSTPETDASVTVTLYRYFGGCADQYEGVIDLDHATGECGVLQVLTNRFNAAHAGAIRVRTQPVEWSAYYDRLNAAYAARRPPDVAVMNRSVLPRYVARRLVWPLTAALRDAGVSLDDVVDTARDGVVYNGDVYAIPFDLHVLLWHVNVGLLRQAGLIDAGGQPILPSTPAMVLEHAELVAKRTGKRYFAVPSQTDPMPTWAFESWVWQEGADLLTPDTAGPTFDTPAARQALELLGALYANGHADPTMDYAGAEQAFLAGEAAVLLNGTWVVDSYSAQASAGHVALREYRAYAFPKVFAEPAVWSDSHVWVIPDDPARDARRRAAAVEFLVYLFQNSAAWAKTGHLPVRREVLESEAFLRLPSREHYRRTAVFARTLPRSEYHRTLDSILIQHINAVWLAGQAPGTSLRAAQADAVRALRRLQKSR